MVLLMLLRLLMLRLRLVLGLLWLLLVLGLWLGLLLLLRGSILHRLLVCLAGMAVPLAILLYIIQGIVTSRTSTHSISSSLINGMNRNICDYIKN